VADGSGQQHYLGLVALVTKTDTQRSVLMMLRRVTILTSGMGQSGVHPAAALVPAGWQHWLAEVVHGFERLVGA
jgi:hypothetical protein